MKKLFIKNNLYLLFLFYIPGAIMLAYATNFDWYFGGFIWFVGGIIMHKMNLNDPLVWYLVNKYL